MVQTGLHFRHSMTQMWEALFACSPATYTFQCDYMHENTVETPLVLQISEIVFPLNWFIFGSKERAIPFGLLYMEVFRCLIHKIFWCGHPWLKCMLVKVCFYVTFFGRVGVLSVKLQEPLTFFSGRGQMRASNSINFQVGQELWYCVPVPFTKHAAPFSFLNLSSSSALA